MGFFRVVSALHGTMISGGWVCVLHVRTAGLGGAALGSDEEEVVYLAYVIIDVSTNQVNKRTYYSMTARQLEKFSAVCF